MFFNATMGRFLMIFFVFFAIVRRFGFSSSRFFSILTRVLFAKR